MFGKTIQGQSFRRSVFVLGLCFNALFSSPLLAQMVIPAGGTITQNFNGMGTNASATLPTGFKIGISYASGSTSTTRSGGTSGSNALTGSSAGGAYNFAHGVTASSTDRALGFLSSGSYSSPQSIMVEVENNTGSTITGLEVEFDYEKYRTGTRAFDWEFYSSTNGSSWTARTAGDYSYAADGANAVVNPPTTVSKSFTITGLSIANGASIYFRWQYTGVGGSSNAQGLGIDNVTFTVPPTACSPTKLLFGSQPTTTQQDATMATFTVAVACANNSTYTSCNSGTVTLTFSGCGITGTLARTPVNGVATFNNLKVLRSAQNNVTFTATYSGACGSVASATSNTFNITSPVGGVTTLARHNFDGTNIWTSFTPSLGGDGAFSTSGNSRGVTGSCLAQYYDDCLTGASGSASTATFSKTSLSGYTNLKLKFRMAVGGTQLGGSNCSTGAGVDTDDYIRLESRINGGAWNTTFQMDGFSNYQYGWNSNALTLAYNANSSVSINSEPSVLTVNLPAGTTSAEFRFTFKSNRRHEIWYIDDIEIVGNGTGTPSPLPTANAGADFTGCYGGPNALLGSASNTVGDVAYSWSPSATLSNASIVNPTASNTVATTYTLTVTDEDGCTDTDQITVNVLNGTAGLWTGSVNEDWFNCRNWANGRVPTSTTDVTVPNVANQPDITRSNAYCRNITINTGADMAMSEPISELEVNGSFTNNSGNALYLIGNTGATVMFTGTGNATLGGSSATNFQRLVINKSTFANTITANTAFGVEELLLITRGTLEIGTTITAEAETATVQDANGQLIIKSGGTFRVND